MSDEKPEVLTVDGWEEVYPGMFWSDEDKAHLRVKYSDGRYKVEVKPEDSDVWEEVDSADTMIDAYKKAEKYMKTHSPPKESKFVMEKNGRKYIWHPFEGRWIDIALFEDFHEAYKAGKIKNALDALEWFSKKKEKEVSPTEKFKGIHKELTDKLKAFFESPRGKSLIERSEKESLALWEEVATADVDRFKFWNGVHAFLAGGLTPEEQREVFGTELSESELAELKVLEEDAGKKADDLLKRMEEDYPRYAALKELGWEAHHHSLVPIALGIGILYILKRYYE